MKIAVVGSRTYSRPDIVANAIAKFPAGTVVVSGACAGPDAWAAHVAGCYDLPEPIVFKADWKKLGIAAGFLRNTTIVEAADAVLAFWDGKSRGTKDTITKALGKNLPVLVLDQRGVPMVMTFGEPAVSNP